MQLFAKFLQRCRRRRTATASLLDHSLILYGSGMSNGNVHSRRRCRSRSSAAPALVKGDRHIVAPEQTPLANVLLDLGDKFGVDVDSFGISTGRLEL